MKSPYRSCDGLPDPHAPDATRPGGELTEASVSTEIRTPDPTALMVAIHSAIHPPE
jgi:hypothetical protein